MKSISVVETMGTRELLSPDLGHRLYELIRDALRKNDSVHVDFATYEFLSSSFLNRSLGQISMDFDLDQERFDRRIQIVGLEKDDIDDVRLCVQNAVMRKKLLDKKIDLNQYYSTHLAH